VGALPRASASDGNRQAISRNVRVLILDEPTTAPGGEVEKRSRPSTLN
jgi:hypothetical protein